jgi:hypothetical protein
MIGAYRSIDAIIEDRLARFHARRAREQAPSDAVAGVFADRSGRIAGGIAGTVCGGLVFLSAFVLLGTPLVIGPPREAYAVVPTYLLANSGIAALVVTAIARRAARRRAGASLRQEPALTGDGPEDIGRIERADPLGDLRARAAALETKSVALPLVALALLAPLTIHGIVTLGINVVNGGWVSVSAFGLWIGLSATLVGLAHLTLAIRMALWARSLRGRESCCVDETIHGEWSLTLFITAASAFVPAVFIASDAEILSVIPPVLVLVTGAAFLPFAYVATARRLRRERTILAPDRGPLCVSHDPIRAAR